MAHNTKTVLSSFPLSNINPPLCFTSHNISCYLPPSLSSHIKWYCLYTPSIYHPISHFPRLVYLPWVLGRHEGTLSSSFPLSFPFAFLLFFPPTSAGCLWPLIYEDLLNPGGPVWSTLGEFGWKRGSIVKTQVIYSSTCCLILPGLVKILLEAASANCSISLGAFTFCIRLCWVINVCKCSAGCDKNKHGWCDPSFLKSVVRRDEWQIDGSLPAITAPESSMFPCMQQSKLLREMRKIKVFTCTAVTDCKIYQWVGNWIFESKMCEECFQHIYTFHSQVQDFGLIVQLEDRLYS